MMFERFWNLRALYRRIFQEPKPISVRDGAALLADLREFCRADTSCVVVGKDGKIDTHATLLAEGRREVFLRIQQMLNLSDEELIRLQEIQDD